MTVPPLVSARDIGLTYRQWEDVTQALSGVSFELPSTGWILVTGPNGAGKTTLLDLISGALQPSAGEMRVLGNDPFLMTPPRRARTFGVVRQRPEQSLVAGLTVLEHVKLAGLDWRGFTGRLAGLDPLNQFGFLAGAQRRQVDLLSGGQRRAFGLGLQLVRPTPLFLLDEPFTGLDAGKRAAFEAVLARLGRERCVIQVTHEPDAARLHADFELQVDRGQVTPKVLSATKAGPVPPGR